MNEIEKFLQDLKLITAFDCKIDTEMGEISFQMNVGVGYSKLDTATGHLRPPDFDKTFKLTEIDFDLKYVSYILKNNPEKICKNLLASNEVSYSQDPDFWNLYMYLNDPKRGVNNTNRLVRNLERNSIKLFRSHSPVLLKSHIALIISTLEELKEKVELESKIDNLRQEIVGSQADNSSVRSARLRENLSKMERVLKDYCQEYDNLEYVNNK
jgi:hypothetical protein